MKLLIRACICTLLTFIAFTITVQDSSFVSFSFDKTRVNFNEVLIRIRAKIKPGIKLYAIKSKEADPLYTTITFDTSYAKKLDGAIIESAFKKEKDVTLNAEVRFFEDSATWQQKVKATTFDSFALKGNVAFMYKKGEEYLSGEQAFKYFIEPEVSTVNTGNNSIGITGSKSLWWIFITAFAGGLLAILTPCVYSMIPITVSFFTKRSKNRSEGIRNALYYSLSIVIIFTLLGFLITLLLGPAALNNLATNWIANLVFFALFLLFGISFLGAFEIALPSSWSTKADTKAGMSGFVSIFLWHLRLCWFHFQVLVLSSAIYWYWQLKEVILDP